MPTITHVFRTTCLGERIRRRLVHESFKFIIIIIFGRTHNNEFEHEQYHETIKYNPKLAIPFTPSRARTHSWSIDDHVFVVNAQRPSKQLESIYITTERWYVSNVCEQAHSHLALHALSIHHSTEAYIRAFQRRQNSIAAREIDEEKKTFCLRTTLILLQCALLSSYCSALRIYYVGK